MFEGITVFSKSASLTPSVSRPTKVTLHTYVILAGIMCAFAGKLNSQMFLQSIETKSLSGMRIHNKVYTEWGKYRKYIQIC